MPHRRWIILAVFVLSGAAALIDEIVWSRQLVLVFGNTTQAVSAILTGFFGGMAVGSVVGGRIADRVRVPLRMYGLLELVLVVVVLLTPVSFRPDRRPLQGRLPGARGLADGPRARAGRAGRARPGARDRAHGRDTPDPDPPSRPERRAELGLQPAVRREHDRGDRRDGGGRVRADRGVRAVRRAGDRRRVLRGCRRAGSAAGLAGWRGVPDAHAGGGAGAAARVGWPARLPRRGSRSRWRSSPG